MYAWIFHYFLPDVISKEASKLWCGSPTTTNCYYNIPPELPLAINEMGENFKITDELKPYAKIEWDKYKSGDFELTED